MSTLSLSKGGRSAANAYEHERDPWTRQFGVPTAGVANPRAPTEASILIAGMARVTNN